VREQLGAAPTRSVDAADKTYVDTAIAAIPTSGMLKPVQVVCVGSETFTVVSGSVTQIAGATVAGYTPAVGDRLLIVGAPAATGVGQAFGLTTEPANGIYVVTSNTTNLSVSRSADMSGSISPAGLSVFNENGSWQGATIWTVITPASSAAFTYGTGNIKWAIMAGLTLTPFGIFVQSGGTFALSTSSAQTVIAPATSPGAQTLTLPATATSDTLVGRASTDTLTNKTLVAPALANAAGASLGIIDGEQFCALTSPHTLTSQTAAQPIFNATTNGAVTLPVGTYFFECFFTLTALSTSNSDFGFALTAGTATIASQLWQSMAGPTALNAIAAAPGTADPSLTVNNGANTNLVVAVDATSGVGWAKITGMVRISGAGTVIPKVSLAVAAAAVVGTNSYFRIWQVGSNTVTTVGAWS
jgi:hypothetical protein